MQSRSVTAPASHRNCVSSTFVSGTYRRVTCQCPLGVIANTPASGSSNRPKIEGLSYSGQHSQSIAPSRVTSAADRPSPMSA